LRSDKNVEAGSVFLKKHFVSLDLDEKIFEKNSLRKNGGRVFKEQAENTI
jgi:hypothetical protein